MEFKKYKFSVNTADKCFLCFGEADFSNYNSLGNILHCLKLNLTELHSLSSKSPSLLNKTDFKIRLCSDCGLIIQKFSKEYETLQLYKMKVASTLEVIKTKLSQVRINPKVEAVKEEDTKFLKHCKIVEELRSKMVKKCEIKIDRVLPKVRIKKINLEDVEVKQKTVCSSESAPIVALEIKLEPINDNFEEDSFFNSDFQTESFETVSTPAEESKPKKRAKKRVANPPVTRRVKKKYYKPCPLCRLPFSSQLKLRCHFKTHLTEKCSLCRKKFPSTELLNLHLQQHKISNFNCEICGEKFTNNLALFSHAKTHKNQNELFYCNFCGAGCKSEDRLKMHQERVHSDKNLPCSFCSRTFSSKALVRNHEKTHLEHRPFKCTFQNCEMAYPTIRKRNHHMKVHSEELPYKCQWCGKGFPYKGKLNRHSQIHKVERSRINCDLCPASFLYRKNLITHSRNVHGLVS